MVFKKCLIRHLLDVLGLVTEQVVNTEHFILMKKKIQYNTIINKPNAYLILIY